MTWNYTYSLCKQEEANEDIKRRRKNYEDRERQRTLKWRNERKNENCKNLKKEGTTECPTSYWIVYTTKLRTSGLIRKFKKNESLWKNCKNVDFSSNACVFSR